MSTELQQNRYDQLLRRVGGIIGVGSKVSEVIPELFPMIDVENVPGELLLLMGTRVGIGGINILAVAGEFPRTQIFNPVDSGTIIAVTSVLISPDVTQPMTGEVTAIPQTIGVSSEQFRDGRLIDVATPTAEIRGESNVAAVANVMQIIAPGNETTTLEDPNGVAVLSPGSGLEIGGTLAASKITVTFNWRERTAQQSELNF